MHAQTWLARSGRLAMVIGAALLLGCQTNTPDPNGNTGEYTTGATLDPERFANLPRAINPFAAGSTGQLPAAADVLKDLPPIGDQGQMGSCTAWAAGYAGATATANRAYSWGPETPAHQGSPGYLYTMLVEADAEQGTACGTGTLISTAMDLLAQSGCSSLATVDYVDSACLEPLDDDAANFRIGSYKRVDPTDRNGVKAELAAGNILVIGAQLYDDFMDYTGGVYTGSGVLLTQGNQHAAHAMACVGYDDAQGAYRIMNSWSTQWGESGFMWMDYDTFEATVFEVYALMPNGDREPQPAPDPAEDPAGYLDDAFQFADEDPVSGEITVYLVFYYHFDAPVLIHTITVTDPNGDSGTQTYETWYSDGYVAFQKTGGFQWAAGVYDVTFETTTEGGNSIVYQGQAEIAALGDDVVGEDEVCENLCEFAYDGECDDGGPGSDYAVCGYGTDCADCGPRPKDDGVSGERCTDTCPFAGDGACDDGGPGAAYAVCDYGTDCTDCGPRSGEPGGGDVDDFTSICFDYCEFAYDGECDDGGPGAAYAVCDFGSDCYDCGERALDDLGLRQVTHRFRGVEVAPKARFADLPAAGVAETDLGENDHPLVVTRATDDEASVSPMPAEE